MYLAYVSSEIVIEITVNKVITASIIKVVTKDTSRMKESVLFHEEEEEKKHTEFKKQMKQMETREKTAQEVIDKSKVVIAHLKARAKENEGKNKKEVAQLKGELEVEERNQQIKTNEEKKKKEVAHLQNSFHIRLDGLKKKLDNKDEVIGELKKHNAGLRVAFDLNAGVNMQIEDLDAKIEEANLEARNLKRSRQDLEVAVGPEMKKVCAAVIQLRSNDVANGLKVIDASAKIIAPAVAMSKNAKRRAQRARNGGGNGLKGNKYCGICKEFFRLDL